MYLFIFDSGVKLSTVILATLLYKPFRLLYVSEKTTFCAECYLKYFRYRVELHEYLFFDFHINVSDFNIEDRSDIDKGEGCHAIYFLS